MATNDGDVTLSGVSISDPTVGALSCSPTQPAALAPGASLICDGSHIVSQADLDAGSIGNSANAAGQDPQGQPVVSLPASVTVPTVQNPHLSLTKSASPVTYNAVGQVINYTLVGTNDGNVTLTGVSISDPTVGALSCTPAQPATLAPGGTLSCIGSHTVAQADLDAGSISNTATATGMPVTYAATLSGPAEVPPNASAGVGNAIFDIDTSTHTLRMRVTFSGLTGNTTASHIHAATTVPGAGTAGVATQLPTFAGFPLGVTAGTYDHTFDLTLASSWNPSFITAHGGTPAGAEAFFAASVAAGKAYLNIHSSFAPGGEIRGFLSGGSTVSATASATVTAVQTPALTFTKSAVPTIYSYPGQVIVYTYVVQNTGNVTLSGPYTITDDKLGTIACGAGSLAPNASITCTQSYTIVASDLNAANNASITNRATAAGKFGNNTVTSNQAQATINQVAPTGKITPTNTTCQAFANGTHGDLLDEIYKVKANQINSIAPGVFFYYSKITAPASSFTIQVTQSDILARKKIGTMQIILWDANCVKTSVPGAYNAGTGTVTFNASGLTAGATYYISIKYNPRSLVGQDVPPNKPTDVYTFVTYLNGSQIIPSWDSVNVKSK